MPQATINLSASGDNTIITSTGYVNIYDYTLTANAAVTVIIKDSATEWGRYTFPAGGGSVPVSGMGMGIERFATKGNVVLNLSGNVTVTGHITYSTRP